MKTSYSVLAAALALACSGHAMAQKAGSLSVSVGFTALSPAVDSGNLSAPSLPNTKVGVNSNTQLGGAINYMVTDNIAVSVPWAFPFKHEVTGAGAIAGAGKLADTKALPVTVLGQWRFMDANAQFRPYLGAGLTYAKFYGTNGTAVLTALTNPGGPATTLSFKSKLVPTVQLGAVFNLTEKWYVDANYTKTILSTSGSLSTGQTINVKLNPSSFSVGVGYKF